MISKSTTQPLRLTSLIFFAREGTGTYFPQIRTSGSDLRLPLSFRSSRIWNYFPPDPGSRDRDRFRVGSGAIFVSRRIRIRDNLKSRIKQFCSGPAQRINWNDIRYQSNAIIAFFYKTAPTSAMHFFLQNSTYQCSGKSKQSVHIVIG